MIIREIIAEADEKSWAQSAKDFGSEWATGVASVPGDLWDLTKKTATSAAKDFVDPESYKQDWEAIKRGAKFAASDPKGALKHAAQSTDDFVNALANRATFGLADKGQAALNALTGYDTSRMGKIEKIKEPTDYEAEKTKQYYRSQAKAERSPSATKAGDIAGTLVSPPFLAGAKAAGTLGRAIVPKVVQKSLTQVPGQTAKNIAKGTVTVPAKVATDIAGGIAGDQAAAAAVKKIDPYDPYHGEEEFRAFEDKNSDLVRLKDLVNYRL